MNTNPESVFSKSKPESKSEFESKFEFIIDEYGSSRSDFYLKYL